jgi:hypothetical protein
MFMNEQELYEYRLNKFKDAFLKVYLTVIGIGLFMFAMVAFI